MEFVYMYKAAMHCEECGLKIIAKLGNKEDTGDSDDYPQLCSNYERECDYPDHCDTCGCFLENSLTSDGEEYVREHLVSDPDSEVVKQWAEYYSITICEGV